MRTLRGLTLILPRLKPRAVWTLNALTLVLTYALPMAALMAAFLVPTVFNKGMPAQTAFSIIALTAGSFGLISAVGFSKPHSTKTLLLSRLGPKRAREAHRRRKAKAVQKALALRAAKHKMSEKTLAQRDLLHEEFLRVTEALVENYGQPVLYATVIAHDALTHVQEQALKEKK